MRHYALLLVSLFVLNSYGQIVLEHTYTDIDRYSFTSVFLDVDGYKYMSVKPDKTEINIYNTDHTIYKNIPLSMLPKDSLYFYSTVKYVGQKIFDNDNGVEVLISFSYQTSEGQNVSFVTIVDEDGSELLKIDDASLGFDNDINDGQFIFFTEDGIKLHVLKDDAIAQIYSLPGTYIPANSDFILEFNNDTLSLNQSKVYLGDYSQNLNFSNDTLYLTDGGWVYLGSADIVNIEGVITQMNFQETYIMPNPTANNHVVINYSIPENTTDSYLHIYDIKGNLQNTTFLPWSENVSQIDLSTLPEGSYFYCIVTSAGNSKMKKFIKY